MTESSQAKRNPRPKGGLKEQWWWGGGVTRGHGDIVPAFLNGDIIPAFPRGRSWFYPVEAPGSSQRKPQALPRGRSSILRQERALEQGSLAPPRCSCLTPASAALPFLWSGLSRRMPWWRYPRRLRRFLTPSFIAAYGGS